MKRMLTLGIASAIVLLVAATTQAQKPNIVLIFADDKYYPLLAMIPKPAKNRRIPAKSADFWIAENSGQSMGITGN